MPAGSTLVLTQLEDGTTRVTWPWGVNAQYHALEICQGERVLHSATVTDGASCILPALPETEEVTIRVRSARNYRLLFAKEDRVRYGERMVEVTGVFAPPAMKDLVWTADPEAKTVDLNFQTPEGSTVRMYYVEPDGTRWQMPVLTEKFSLTPSPM